jgi:hypothetical protein
MATSPKPPPLRDGAIRFRELVAYARFFDEISGRERYAAVDFTTRLSAEVSPESAKRRHQSLPAGRPGLFKGAA